MAPNRVKLAILAGAMALLAACQDGFSLPGADAADTGEGGGAAEVSRTTRLVERDIEVPEVFQKSEAGLWDGRPSLGGVWVAHPDVKDPERVIIRNEVNQKFVIGALFRRERDNPGPRLQVSSDAAEALGLLAGQPVKLNVTALRREEVEETSGDAPADAAPDADTLATIEAPAPIEALTLDDAAPAAPAGDIATTGLAPVPAAAPAPAPQPAKAAGQDKGKVLQIGIFTVEGNAENTAAALRGAGLSPTVSRQSTRGKTFFSVTVGPTATQAERDQLLAKVKALGFNDAYFTAS